MKIESHEIAVRDVCAGYVNKDEGGVVGYGGKLDIRPAYQREFVYKDQQRDAVIHTVRQGFPLNVMYWAVNPDGIYEVLDGQQRTLSLCDFVEGTFSLELPDKTVKFFHNMTDDEQRRILDYKLLIYFCEGAEAEKLAWFKVINIAGEKLTEQELRNAVYTGPWLTDAKRYFSRTNGPAHQVAKDFMDRTAIRQEYLETALQWISSVNGCRIEDYMAANQHKPNALALWTHFQTVLTWAKALFGGHLRKEMKSVPWNDLYIRFHDKDCDPAVLEAEVARLLQDDDVTRKSGIYSYALSREEKHLNIRAFTPSQRREAYERQKGVCPACVKSGAAKTAYAIDEMEADHILPWSKGGKTNALNCKMLCQAHNREKSDN
jgi:hypothetical protein